MVSKALQTQRRFLNMVTTHQEPAQVRHSDTFSCSLSMARRVKGINCSLSLLSLTCSNTLFHSVILTSFPVAKAATGIHACSSISQSSSWSRHSSIFLCLVSVSVASFTAVCRFSNFHRNMEKTWASCPASWLGFEHQKCFL